MAQQPKPILVIRIPNTTPIEKADELTASIKSCQISDEYHVFIIMSTGADYKFEVYNADKIEKQDRSEIISGLGETNKELQKDLLTEIMHADEDAGLYDEPEDKTFKRKSKWTKIQPRKFQG